MTDTKRILIVAAHPDDEILGCGGTINKLADQGHELFTLILGEGITARDLARNPTKRKKELETLKKQVQKANKLIGVTEVFTFDLPDNRFDSVTLLDVVKIVEEVKERVSPEVVFTHYGEDLNIDHRVTFKAVLTAFRPVHGSSVKEIYSFEVPSSTEWNYPQSFSPNFFVDISKNVKKKQEALKIYENELRDYPHPRSAESIKDRSKYWGSTSGLKYAEAFEVVRIVDGR